MINREAACLEFIRSGFDLESTVSWMKKWYTDDPIFLQSGWDRYCRNIITMSNNRRDYKDRQINILAFSHAFDAFTKEFFDRRDESWQNRYLTLERELEREKDLRYDAEGRAAKLSRETQVRANDPEGGKFGGWTGPGATVPP